MNQTQALEEKHFDPDEWQKFYYRHQQQYIRNRWVQREKVRDRERGGSLSLTQAENCQI